MPTALTVDATNSTVYVADGGSGHTRVEYFNVSNCNATTFAGCSTVATSSVTVGNDPVAVALSNTNLYVANAGSGGGISVVNLGTYAVSTISTGPGLTGIDGTGLVQVDRYVP